jgi:general secretion pathway protein M
MLKIKLAKREKYIVSIAACLISLFVILNFLVFPFLKERERLSKGIKTAGEDLKEIEALSVVYQKYQKGSMDVKRILSRRDKGFTLFSYLEKAAGEIQVKDHIEYMKPSSSKGSGPYEESMVEMKLNGINTDQLVKYLYEIEQPEDLIFVKRISISDNKKQEGYLDSVIQVLTYQ